MGSLSQPSWLSLRPNPLPHHLLMPHLRLGMDITMVVGQDITEDTEDTMDGADTTDTPTDTDTTEENALLLPKLPLRLMLMPLPGIIVDTMDTPTDTDTTVWDTVHTMVDTTDIPTDTDTVTGDKGLSRIRTHGHYRWKS